MLIAFNFALCVWRFEADFFKWHPCITSKSFGHFISLFQLLVISSVLVFWTASELVFVSLPLVILLDNFNRNLWIRTRSSFISSHALGPVIIYNCVITLPHSQSTRMGSLSEGRSAVSICTCCQNGYNLGPQLDSPEKKSNQVFCFKTPQLSLSLWSLLLIFLAHSL